MNLNFESAISLNDANHHLYRVHPVMQELSGVVLYHSDGPRLIANRLAGTLAPPKIQIDTIPSHHGIATAENANRHRLRQLVRRHVRACGCPFCKTSKPPIR
jgi:hypothetical protein